VVVGGRHLDDVHPGERQLHGDPADGVEQLARGEPTRLGGPGARREPGVDDVDVDREEHGVALVGRDGECLGEHLVEPATHDLGHLVAAHLLLGHPRQRLGLGPVATQADLQKRSRVSPRLDEAAHGRPVPVERTELRVAGVGVGVEVDDRDPSPTDVAGDTGHIGQGDRVITAEHHGDRPRRGDAGHGRLEPLERQLGVAGRHLDVAHVDHAQFEQWVHVQGEVGPAPVMGR